jgi:hypothetical protein
MRALSALALQRRLRFFGLRKPKIALFIQPLYRKRVTFGHPLSVAFFLWQWSIVAIFIAKDIAICC